MLEIQSILDYVKTKLLKCETFITYYLSMFIYELVQGVRLNVNFSSIVNHEPNKGTFINNVFLDLHLSDMLRALFRTIWWYLMDIIFRLYCNFNVCYERQMRQHLLHVNFSFFNILDRIKFICFFRGLDFVFLLYLKHL